MCDLVQYHTNIGIHPDNGYLDTLEQPCRTTLSTYTQSQKKRTMNSLASSVIQGHGQVTPTGSHLIMQI